MSVKCEKYNCVANFNGECVVDRCDGEMIMIPACKNDREIKKRFYETTKEMFDEDFKEISKEKATK